MNNKIKYTLAITHSFRNIWVWVCKTCMWHVSIRICLTAVNSICRLLCVRALRLFFQPLEKHSSSTHCREIPRRFWFLYILCSELLYKELPLLFIYLFSAFLASYLPASGSFPQWEDNPESSRGSFDLALIFPNSYIYNTDTRTQDWKVLWELLFTVCHGLALKWQELWIFSH